MTPDLNDPTVRDALKQAWLDSHPGITGGHEEGESTTVRKFMWGGEVVI